MTYKTDPFLRLPIRVSTSDSPYNLVVEIEFSAFDGRTIDKSDYSQHLNIRSSVSVRTRSAAQGIIDELREAANDIERYMPNMNED